MTLVTESSVGLDIEAIVSDVGNLPTIPAVALEVIAAAEDPDCSIAKLAGVLGTDPALAAKVLRVSNSSMYAIGQEVTNLERAVMVLGVKTVKLLSLSFALVDRLDEDFPAVLPPSMFWRRSLLLSVAAQHLADATWKAARDEAFLAGLLGYVGKIVLARALPEAYVELGRTAETSWPSVTDERAALGLGSDAASAAVLRAWNLPEFLAVSVASMFEPAAVAGGEENAVRLVNILHCASLTADFIGGGGSTASLAAVRTFAAASFDMDEKAVEHYLLSLEEPLEQLAQLLALDDIDGPSPEEILAKAREAMVEVSLGAAEEMMQDRGRVQQLEQEVDALDELARRDPLTGLANRRAVDEFCHTQLAARNRHELDGVFAILMLDIDFFKSVNDTHGHQVGDAVLTAVAAVLEDASRADELVGRIGGEEFVVIAPMAHADTLDRAGTRLRVAVENAVVAAPAGPLRVTTSVGVAAAPSLQGESELEALFARADEALYEAKRQGRNRVVVAF